MNKDDLKVFIRSLNFGQYYHNSLINIALRASDISDFTEQLLFFIRKATDEIEELQDENETIQSLREEIRDLEIENEDLEQKIDDFESEGLNKDCLIEAYQELRYLKYPLNHEFYVISINGDRRTFDDCGIFFVKGEAERYCAEKYPNKEDGKLEAYTWNKLLDSLFEYKNSSYEGYAIRTIIKKLLVLYKKTMDSQDNDIENVINIRKGIYKKVNGDK